MASVGEDMFRAFAETLEMVRSTGSRNSKVELLAGLFRRLSPASLQAVTRFLKGKEVPSGDIGVGWKGVVDALTEISGASPKDLWASYLKHGDLGSAAEDVVSRKGRASTLLRQPLTIPRVEKAFLDMAKQAGAGSSSARRRALQGLFADADALELKYLIRIITGDLRVGATGGLTEEALAKAFDVDPATLRDAVLVTGDVGEVAKLLVEGRLAQARPVLYRPVEFMLAEPKASPEEVAKHFSKEAIVEMKYDGIRVQAHVGREVRLYSRRMEEITGSLPEVRDSLSSLGHEAILDGEALGFGGGRPLPFVKMQARLHRKAISEEVIEKLPFHYVVFDLLYLDGRSLLDMKLKDRRIMLEGLRLTGGVSVAPTFSAGSAEGFRKLFEKSRAEGFEGLVVKDPDSPYMPGRRGGHWVKLKEELDTIDAVVVAAEWGNGKRAGLLSDYTFAVWDRGELKVIGKAYSGLTDEEIRSMTETMKKLALRWEGNRCWVRPEVVMEVAFDSIQRSDRHSSGYALRFPRIKAIRTDKAPGQADTIERVRLVYEGQKLK